MMRTLSCGPLVLALVAGAVLPRAWAADDDAAIKAMGAEMARTTQRLQMDGIAPPYFVQYVLDDDENWTCQASFGALMSEGSGGSATVGADIRVGDYDLDNTNFVRGRSLTGGIGRVTAPADLDPDALQHRLWLATDQMYKRAIEDLAAKKAWLQSNNVPDRPVDLIPAGTPMVLLEERLSLDVDRDSLQDLARQLSARFRDAPAIQDSDVYIQAEVSHRTLMNNEGTLVRSASRSIRLAVVASTQAVDGMPIGDAITHYGRTAADLPDAATLTAEVDRLIERLSSRVTAERAEEYIGPVLFEGDAACLVMMELLAERLSYPDEPVGASGAGTPFKNRLKKRVTPPFLHVLDDPTIRTFAGAPLLGAYAVDDDGVAAEAVHLVEEGRLKNWYMSRIPTRAITDSNGHSRGGKGGPACLFVRSENTLAPDALRAELLRVAREQELPYAIRVAAIARADVGVSGARAGGGFSNGNIDLSPPISAWRVYLDGHEEPIRGGDWQGVTLRSLRDIYVTGEDSHVFNGRRRGALLSIVCPSLLIEEIEIKKPEDQERRRPYLDHPHFSE